MGEFGSHTAWIRRFCARLREDLADFDGGHRYFRDQEDITGVLKGRAERDLAHAEQLLASYESRSAPGAIKKRCLTPS